MGETLTKDDFLRYHRQISLPEIGEQGQQRLKNAKVILVGCGGLGCPVALYLAAAGIGTLGIVDNDTVDKTNLQRQVLFGESGVSEPKVIEAKKRLFELNPHIDLRTHNERLATENITDIFSDYDLIVDGSDNFATRYLVNDACVVLDKPFVSASVHGFEGQLSVFNANTKDAGPGPTYRCLFPNPPSPEQMPSCADAGILGVVPGVLGTLQAAEVLKYFLGIGELLSGKLLVVNLLTSDFRTVSFARNDETIKTTRILPISDYLSMQCACPNRNVKNITSLQLKKRLDAGEDICLIDIREDCERARFHIGGKHIRLNDLWDNTDKIPRTKPTVLYCESGARSDTAVHRLNKESGFTNLYSLEGGIRDYLTGDCRKFS